jgi:hypothetical protein
LTDGGVTAGPVFRGVAKGRRVGDRAVVDYSISTSVKRCATMVGFPRVFAAHSLRSRFLTSAAESGASIWKLSEVSRQRSLVAIRGSARRADLFKEPRERRSDDPDLHRVDTDNAPS